jgi:hypothetical protein
VSNSFSLRLYIGGLSRIREFVYTSVPRPFYPLCYIAICTPRYVVLVVVHTSKKSASRDEHRFFQQQKSTAPVNMDATTSNNDTTPVISPVASGGTVVCCEGGGQQEKKLYSLLVMADTSCSDGSDDVSPRTAAYGHRGTKHALPLFPECLHRPPPYQSGTKRKAPATCDYTDGTSEAKRHKADGTKTGTPMSPSCEDGDKDVSTQGV